MRQSIEKKFLFLDRINCQKERPYSLISSENTKC